MRISVILVLEDNGAAGVGVAGWFNMAIAT